MSRFFRLMQIATAAAAVVSLAACAPMRVHSFAERGDGVRHRTYGWSEAFSSTGDPRLDNSPFFFDQVETSVDKELGRRGFEKTAVTPDMLVHIHASVTQEINNAETDRAPYVYEAGTLLLDFVDARTGKLIWRGWAEDTFDGVVDSQEVMNQEVATAVVRIMKQFPNNL